MDDHSKNQVRKEHLKASKMLQSQLMGISKTQKAAKKTPIRMFSPQDPPYTSKEMKVGQSKNKVTHVKKNNLTSLLGPSTKLTRPLKLEKPQKIIKNSVGIRPDVLINGDQSVPASIWSASPSKVVDNTIIEDEDDDDDTMIEMSIDEHSYSKPQQLPIPILAAKPNAVIVHRKEDQLNLLRTQLHMNKELQDRASSNLSLSQKVQFGIQ